MITFLCGKHVASKSRCYLDFWVIRIFKIPMNRIGWLWIYSLPASVPPRMSYANITFSRTLCDFPGYIVKVLKFRLPKARPFATFRTGGVKQTSFKSPSIDHKLHHNHDSRGIRFRGKSNPMNGAFIFRTCLRLTMDGRCLSDDGKEKCVHKNGESSANNHYVRTGKAPPLTARTKLISPSSELFITPPHHTTDWSDIGIKCDAKTLFAVRGGWVVARRRRAMMKNKYSTDHTLSNK